MKRAILLFAHGARDPRWAEPFEAIAARIRTAEPALVVELAYLELMTPDFDGAARRLLDAACSHVDVVPLFLGAGGHVRKDLPRLVERWCAEAPAVAWRLHAPVGEAPDVIDAIARAAVGLPTGGAVAVADNSGDPIPAAQISEPSSRR